jgi:hypothetical protein
MEPQPLHSPPNHPLPLSLYNLPPKYLPLVYSHLYNIMVHFNVHHINFLFPHFLQRNTSKIRMDFTNNCPYNFNIMDLFSN